MDDRGGMHLFTESYRYKLSRSLELAKETDK
jgi:hypothetical protein